MLNPKCIAILYLTSPKTQGSLQKKGAERLWELDVVGDWKQTGFSRNNSTIAHRNPQWLQQLGKGPCKFKLDRIQAWKADVDTKCRLVEDLLVIIVGQRKGMSF